MDPEECRTRRDALKERVANLDVHHWADRFLSSIVTGA
jgi:trehalose-6-phosphate synthase